MSGFVAADYSLARRRLAEKFGADLVVDPAEQPAIEAWRGIDGSKPLVIFEAVGVPGMLQSLIADAPPHTRIVVVGVCMHTDTIEPFMAVTKEIEMRFSFGYDPTEFAATLAGQSSSENT